MPQETYTARDALRLSQQARDAGQTDKAKEFLDIAERLRVREDQTPDLIPSPADTPEDEPAGVPAQMAEGTARGLGGLADAPGRFISGRAAVRPSKYTPDIDETKTIGEVFPDTGAYLEDPFLGSEGIRRVMSDMGVPTPEEGQEPVNLSEYIAQGTGEGLSYMLPGTGVVMSLKRGAGLAGRVSREMFDYMKRHPWLSMAGETSASAAWGASRGIGEQQDLGPGMQATAEIAGGVAGGLAPAGAVQALRRSPMNLLAQGSFRSLKRFSMPFTKRGGKYRAGEFLKAQTADPEKTAQRVSQKTIGDLPKPVASQEKRLIALYRDVMNKDPVTEAKEIERIGQSMGKLEKTLRGMGWSSPEILRDMTKRRVGAIELSMDHRIAKSAKKAQEKLQDIPYAKRKSAESEIVANELEAVRRQEHKRVSDLYKQVDNVNIGYENTRNEVQRHFDTLPTAQREDIPKALRKGLEGAIRVVNEKGDLSLRKKLPTDGNTTVEEMRGLRSKLLEEARLARKDGRYNTARIADDVAESIDQDMQTASIQSGSPAAANLEVANAAWRHYKERFSAGVVGKILGVDKTGAPKIDPTIVLDQTLARQGARGAIDADKIVVTPEARAATERYLGRNFTDYAFDENMGQLNPKKAQDWIRNNQEVLDKFPELRQRLQDAGSASELAQKTRTKMMNRKQRLQNPKINSSARFLNQDIKKEIKNIVNKDDARAAKNMMNMARKDKTGEAVDGVRAALVDDMFETARARGPRNEHGEKTLSGKTLKDYLRNHSEVIGETFSAEQRKRLNQISNELYQIERLWTDAGAAPDMDIQDTVANLLSIGSRVGGAQTGRWLAASLGGGTVQTPGIISGKARAFMRRMSLDKMHQFVTDAVLEPDGELFRALLAPMDKPGTDQYRATMRTLDKRLNAWLGGPGRRVWEDIEREKAEEEARAEQISLKEHHAAARRERAGQMIESPEHRPGSRGQPPDAPKVDLNKPGGRGGDIGRSQ